MNPSLNKLLPETLLESMKTTEAQKRYETSYQEIKALLKSIDNLVTAKHNSTIKEKDINWGHVGDIGEVARLLSQVNDYLNLNK